jgi:transposase
MLGLLVEGRLPEAWIAPAQILELRARVRLRKAMIDERHEWQQRIQAQLYHQGVKRGIRLRSAEGRKALAAAEVSPAGRELIECALRIIDHLDRQLEPLDRQLIAFARRQPGCRALQALFGVGEITSVAIFAELGDCRRFRSSDDAVRHTGLDVTVWSSDGRRAPGHLARQGPELLRWALFEAALSAARTSSPDRAYYLEVRGRIDHNRACLSVARKLCRRAYHILRELGDEALTPVDCPPVAFPPLAQAA